MIKHPAFLVLAALFGAACSPTPKAPSEPPSSPRAETSPEPERPLHPSLQSVAGHLDTRGLVFSLTNGDYEREGFQPFMDFLQTLFSLAEGQTGDQMNAQEARLVAAMKHLPRILGVHEVQARGQSTTALDNGGYRTVQALQPTADAEGLLWSLHGDAFSIHEEIARAPAHTAQLMRFSINAPKLRRELEDILNTHLPEIAQGFREGETALQALGVPVQDLLESLNSGITISMTLHPERNLPLPVPGGYRVPEPGLALSLEDPNGSLLHAVTQLFGQELPPAFQFVETEREGIPIHRIPALPLPLAMPLNPQVAPLGSRMVFATSDELMDDLIARRDGDLDSPLHRHVEGLESDEAYQLWILTPEVIELVETNTTIAMGMIPDNGQPIAPFMHSYLRMFTRMVPRAMTSRMEDGTGVTTVLHDHAQLSAELGGSSALVAPAFLGLTASMAVPGFTRARETAQRNACVNNLRVMEGAKDMWAIEQGKTDGSTPTFNDLSEYIRERPECPSGGIYTLGDVGESAACSQHGSLN